MKRDLIFLMSKMVAIAVQFLGQGHFNLNECVCVCGGGSVCPHLQLLRNFVDFAKEPGVNSREKRGVVSVLMVCVRVNSCVCVCVCVCTTHPQLPRPAVRRRRVPVDARGPGPLHRVPVLPVPVPEHCNTASASYPALALRASGRSNELVQANGKVWQIKHGPRRRVPDWPLPT